ncbi:MAG: acyl-ACP--UDP-N-acetylglucosamine O-acyltransferase [Candidatus Omnitrophota bacterium]
MQTHPTAIISKKAKLHKSVKVGPYSNIGDNVNIGKDTEIGANCQICGNATIGERCKIFTGAVIGSIPQDLKFKGEKSSLVIGNDNVIREYTTINLATGDGGKTIVGSGNLIMAYAHIAHDCNVGNECIIANCGTLAGHVIIEDKVIIGGLAAIHQFSRVGTLSIIGGCSKVVQDIPPYSTCDGHPARVYGLNLIGLKRAGLNSKVILELRRAFKVLFFSHLTTSTAIKKIKKEIPESKYLTHLIEFIANSQRGVTKNK